MFLKQKKDDNKPKQMKKAQAAMDFLLTYSWAIVAVLVVVGLLAYFGVFDVEKIFPERCVVGHPFQCDDYSLSINDQKHATFNIRLSNLDQKKIAVANLSIESEELDTDESKCTLFGTEQIAFIERSEPKSFEITHPMNISNPGVYLNSSLESGCIVKNERVKAKYNVIIDYRYVGGFLKRSQGEILVSAVER